MDPRHGTFIWERMGEGRGSRRLDYSDLVKAAMKLADRDGIEAVSMRNVAAALNAGTMSLYRYVTGKDDLLDLILDAAYGEIRLPQSGSLGWQERFRRVAVESRRVMKSHPWLASLISRRPTLGPHYLKWFEYLLAASAASGRDIDTRVRMIGTVWAYVSGFIAYELGELETNRKYKLTEAKKRKAAQPYVDRVLATGDFPHLAEFLKRGRTSEPTDDDFISGLNAVLAGVASL